MPDLPPRQLLLYGLAALAFLVLAAWYLGRGDGAAAAPTGAAAPLRVHGGGKSGGPALIVDVAGAVRRPGVYRLPAGSRVEDALRDPRTDAVERVELLERRGVEVDRRRRRAAGRRGRAGRGRGAGRAAPSAPGRRRAAA
jgi:competence protein ComEA